MGDELHDLHKPHMTLPAPLAVWTGVLCLHAARRFVGLLETRLAAIGLRPLHFNILSVLDEQAPIAQHELGERIGKDPSTMVALVDDLVEAGYVARDRNPADRRYYALDITEAGRARLADIRDIYQTVHDEWLAALSATERQELHRLLGQLVIV